MPRPDGPLIWLHLPLYEGAGPIRTLLARARDELGPLNAVVTFDKPAPGTEDEEQSADFILRPTPAENQSDSNDFIAHWRPQLLIWVSGPFRPVLLAEADAAGVPRVLVNARADALGSVTGTWVPGMSRALIGPFRHVLTKDQEAADRLTRMGIAPETLEVVGRLDDDPEPPSCDEAERSRLAQVIGPRPIWLAAEAPLEEVVTLTTAFRAAQKRAHRLLMILSPATPRDGPAIRDMLVHQGVRTALRSEGADPDENTEVLVADRRSELGLWLRLAPITYLGGSIAGSGGLHPFVPASLGSAIIHGPRLGAYERQAGRLAEVGATRVVASGAELALMIERLLPPNKSAGLAHAAWKIIGSNAAVTNRMTEIIAGALTEAGY